MPKEKIKTPVELYELLPENERLIVDVLRQTVLGILPDYCREKLTFNVPYFYGKKGICIIWPATIPRGGIKKGVLFGFWYGNRLKDPAGYLTHGTNKQVFYKVYQSVDEISFKKITALLKEAIILDNQW